MRSRYKKFKEAEFFTRTDTVTSSVFAFLQILSRSCFIVEVLDTKIQRGTIFQRTDLSFKTAQKGKEKHQKLTDF